MGDCLFNVRRYNEECYIQNEARFDRLTGEEALKKIQDDERKWELLSLNSAKCKEEREREKPHIEFNSRFPRGKIKLYFSPKDEEDAIITKAVRQRQLLTSEPILSTTSPPPPTPLNLLHSLPSYQSVPFIFIPPCFIVIISIGIMTLWLAV
jgi:hypothetical protein